jgi:nucleotide-binding universal stress UspA family protein
VVVDTLLLAGEAEERILQASRHAALVVVGRPHIAAVGGWLRSVARAVLDQSGCPLAVASSPRTRPHPPHLRRTAASA